MMNKQQKVVGVAASHRELDGTQQAGNPSQIVQAGRQFGWHMIDLRTWQFELPPNLQLDGLIINLFNHESDIIPSLLKRAAIGVSIGHNHGIADLSVAEADDTGIGTRVAEYFLDRGYRSLATCTFFAGSNRESLSAFAKHARDMGASCSHLHINPDDTGVPLDEQFRCIKHQLLKLTLPQAIFCTNDRLAARLCQWCLDLNLAVPEQVAIMGAGNDPLTCECSSVPLSSIALINNTMGMEAAKLLQRIMDGEVESPIHLKIPVGNIITRRSTDMLSIDNLTVAKATRFIEDHYMEDLGLDDVASACKVSRRTLTGCFKAQFGATINEHINRRRITKACELLSQTDESAVDIAARSGFLSPQSFSRKFKQSLQMTPQAYRKKDRENRHLAHHGDLSFNSNQGSLQ